MQQRRKFQMDLKLRDYQKEVLDIIDKLEPGSYLIQMATGLGKTATFTNIKRKGREHRPFVFVTS